MDCTHTAHHPIDIREYENIQGTPYESFNYCWMSIYLNLVKVGFLISQVFIEIKTYLPLWSIILLVMLWILFFVIFFWTQLRFTCPETQVIMWQQCITYIIGKHRLVQCFQRKTQTVQTMHSSQIYTVVCYIAFLCAINFYRWIVYEAAIF